MERPAPKETFLNCCLPAATVPSRLTAMLTAMLTSFAQSTLATTTLGCSSPRLAKKVATRS